MLLNSGNQEMNMLHTNTGNGHVTYIGNEHVSTTGNDYVINHEMNRLQPKVVTCSFLAVVTCSFPAVVQFKRLCAFKE